MGHRIVLLGSSKDRELNNFHQPFSLQGRTSVRP